jgi:hypothetical protein
LGGADCASGLRLELLGINHLELLDAPEKDVAASGGVA